MCFQGLFSNAISYGPALLGTILGFGTPTPTLSAPTSGMPPLAPSPTSWLSIYEGSSIPKNEKKLHKDGEQLVVGLWKKLLSENEGSSFVVDDISKWMDEGSRMALDGTARDGRACFEFSANQGKDRYIEKQFTLVRILVTGDPKSREQTIRNEYKRVLRELHIWSKLRNCQDQNIVSLEFVSFLPKNRITVISKKMPTNLREAFNNPKYSEINYITIVQGIASGLQFLHAFQQTLPTGENGEEEKISHIIHSDVKCANVLLRGQESNLSNSEFISTPYLTDFGVSHELIEGSFTKAFDTTGAQPIATFPWMAPELWQHKMGKVSYTKEADVWSFGMTIYEIVTKNDPWINITQSKRENEAYSAIEKEVSSERYPPWPNTLPGTLQSYSTKLEDLFQLCCNYKSSSADEAELPHRRPTMNEVVEKLASIFNPVITTH